MDRLPGRGLTQGPARRGPRWWWRFGVILLSVAALLVADGLVRLPGEQDPAARRRRPKKLIKIATIAPEGSTWMKLMHEMNDRVQEETGGVVGFKFYPGGTQGSDLDVLRKMRSGQIHGAGLTGVGLGEIESSLRIMELPFMFRSPEEIDRVRDELDPLFERRLMEKGFVLLGWADVGFVYLFSQEPVRSPEDLRQMKMWLWEGDPLAQSLIEACGVSPVPLNVTDVLTSLQTGIINTVYTTPYGCLSLQWFTRLSYMTDLPITHAMGAVVVSKRSFDELTAQETATVHRIADDVFGRLQIATREQNLESIEVVAERNIERVPPDPNRVTEFEAIGRTVWREMTGELYEQALLDQLTDALARMR